MTITTSIINSAQNVPGSWRLAVICRKKVAIFRILLKEKKSINAGIQASRQ